MTRGITDPASYYYRRVYADAVRAVDFVRTLDEVDGGAIASPAPARAGDYRWRPPRWPTACAR